MANDVLNIKLEPCNVKWGNDELGYLDGSIEVALEEQGVEVTAQQEGANILDMLRNGKSVEVSLTIKETSLAQLERIFKAGGAEATASQAEITKVTCVADVAASLNSKYFFLNAANDATKYYVWIDVGNTGTDPAIAGRTGIEVDITSGATASAVASAVQAAVDALGDFSASVSGADVTITNAASGGASDATDDGDTGFTILVTQQGVNAGVVGWGTSKDFSGQYAASKQLNLHPIALASTDLSRDFNFWKAYPMIESINFSGEEIQIIPVTFKVFPDQARPTSIKYFAQGSTR